MKIDGACHCGDITYEAEIDPERVGICHCTDCQMMAGAPFRWVVTSEPGTFRVLRGEPTVYVKTADSGAERPHGFCPRCGTALYSTTTGPEPKTYSLRVGAIAQRAQLIPRRQIWTRSAQPWLAAVPGLPAFEKQP